MALLTILKVPNLMVCFFGLQNCCDPCRNICISNSIRKGERKDLLPFLPGKVHGKSERVPHKDVHKDRQLIWTTILNVVSKPETNFPG